MRQKDLLRPALADIIDLGHPLVRLAREIDWGFYAVGLQCLRASRCGPATAADARSGRRAVHPEAACTTVGRGAVPRWLAEPLLPVLRVVKRLPPAAVRPLVTDALAAAAEEEQLVRADPGEPVGGA